MISVATYPVGEMVANKPNLISLLTSTASATPPWWKEWITPIACLALLGLFWNYVSNDLAEIRNFMSTAEVDIATLQANTKGIENVPSSISRIEDKLKTLSDPSASLARLEEKLKSLERSVYKTKAEAAGFKNPISFRWSWKRTRHLKRRRQRRRESTSPALRYSAIT